MMLTYSHHLKIISNRFQTTNLQLGRINQYFISNGLLLNVSKTKYSFFHRLSRREDILLLLPKSKVNNSEIERSKYLKVLEVLLDENLCCKNTLNVLKVKLLKILGYCLRRSSI